MPWKLLAVAAVAAALWPSLAGAGHAATDCVEPKEAELVGLINAYRAEHGLPALRLQDNLSASAEHRVQAMAARNAFGHDVGGTFADLLTDHGYLWRGGRWSGEDIAAGNATAAETFQQWVDSPRHNAVLLDPRYRDIGVGYTRRAGTTYGWYWAAHVGATARQAPYGADADRC